MKHLIIFTRYPEPGRTKTRLIPALGPEGAAQLHRQMAEKMMRTAQELAKLQPVSIEIQYTGSDLQLMQNWLGLDLTYQLQGTGDLGDRIIQAFQVAFMAGKSSVVIIGTDCPDLSCDILSQAFEMLQHQDVVIGPAQDGGYYLIGLSRLIPELFQGINWGTAEVLQQTITICQDLNCSVAYLPQLSDIDRPEDLIKL